MPINVLSAPAANRIALIAVLGLVSLTSTPARAQWPGYPTPNVPRTADGAVDVDGPVPRTADGHPDLSGQWRVPRGSNGADVEDAPPLAGFLDVGANIEGGLPMQPWAAELRAEREANGSRDNPEAHCLPMGNMQFHTQGAPRLYVQTPQRLVILYEA